MATRSKSFDEETVEKTGIGTKIRRGVTLPWIRIAAFITACVSAVFMTACWLKYDKLVDDLNWYGYEFMSIDDLLPASGFTQTYSYQSAKDSLYQILCAVSTVYLRSCEDRVYKGSGDLSNNLYNALRSFGHIESDSRVSMSIKNGKPYIESDMFDFYVSFENGGYLTNMEGMDRFITDEDINRFKSENKCWYVRRGNEVTADSRYSDESAGAYYITNEYAESFSGYYYDEYVSAGSLPIGWCGKDSFGRYIMCYGPYSDMIVYDFDTSDPENRYILNGYIRVSGQAEYGDVYYDDYVDDFYTMVPLEYSSDYAFYLQDDSGITVLIAPKQEDLAAMEKSYLEAAESGKRLAVRGAVGCIIMLLSVIYLLAVCGYHSAEPEGRRWRKAALIGGWYNEVLILIALGFGFLAALLLDDLTFTKKILASLFDIYEPYNYWAASAAVVFFMAGALIMTIAVICKMKARCFFRDFLMIRLISKAWGWCKRKSRESGLFRKYEEKTLSRKLFIRTWIYTAALAVFLIIAFAEFATYGVPEFLLFISAVGMIAVSAWYTITQFMIFRDMSALDEQIDLISKGEETENTLPERSAAYGDGAKLAEISQGIKETVEKQVQSERMKVELVTNVSHDLKTPLTSIISYIDLLKAEEMSPEARDYVQILETKSEKLKNIVSDVFSLAKASSGVDIDLEKLDAVILLNQALADAQDKIERSGKQIKVNIQPASAPIMGDGNKLYRVFQNLIDNALNYSMDGTRIFLTVTKDSGYVRIEMKNTASYEMDFSPEEITERFVRGDKSRTNGGNGLGLSIAKTFTEACGGAFNIELDGDVFKAIALFRLTDGIPPAYKEFLSN